MSIEAPMLPFFAALETQQEVQRHEARVAKSIESMRNCWPEWEGPRVEDSIHGRCSVGQCCVFSETHGDTRYLYCAPCRILEVGPGNEWVRAVVDYPEGSVAWVMHHNGTIVKMDITEVWPPVKDLWEIRRRGEGA